MHINFVGKLFLLLCSINCKQTDGQAAAAATWLQQKYRCTRERVRCVHHSSMPQHYTQFIENSQLFDCSFFLVAAVCFVDAAFLIYLILIWLLLILCSSSLQFQNTNWERERDRDKKLVQKRTHTWHCHDARTNNALSTLIEETKCMIYFMQISSHIICLVNIDLT